MAGAWLSNLTALWSPVESLKNAESLENSMEVPKKTKNRTTVQSHNSTPGYVSEENKTLIWKETHTPIFTAA